MALPSMKHVEPKKLTKESRFKFSCHKGVQCFTKCCSQINILLTTYDIIRMKKRLGVTSEEFLERYTTMDIEEKTSHPFVMLKMLDTEGKPCPFVTSDGCTIYEDRPANCRYYPIGQASLRKGGEQGPEHEKFFFFIREPHCLGYQEDAEWTIELWRKDQGVDPVFQDHIQFLLDEGARMVPAIASARRRGAYMSTRPLIGAGSSGRDVARTFKCVDHKRTDNIEGFVTITGGKATTSRALAEAAADVVCLKLGFEGDCCTRNYPLLSYRQFYTNDVVGI